MNKVRRFFEGRGVLEVETPTLSNAGGTDPQLDYFEVEGKHFRGMEYGYLWWIISRKKNIYAAIGNSGNVIYINPEKRLVVAVASYFKPTVFDRVDFIQKYIEPFAESAAAG